tara:strand:+ start:14076 stop:15422 length:1347 start_codon:yes stop_codon:yes gene_type:complete
MFRLLRYFSLASAAVIVIVIAVLMFFTQHLSVEDLVRLGERQNEILARSIGNNLSDDFGPYFQSVKEADIETAETKSKAGEISESIALQIEGLPVLKVEFLNLKGIVIFSTRSEQAGRDMSRDPDFIAARKGQRTSKIKLLNSDSKSAQKAEQVKSLASYQPFYDDEGKVVGVLQVYSDTTSLFADIDKHVFYVFLALSTALGLLYLVLHQIVRRADKIIKAQHTELQLSTEKLVKSEAMHRKFTADVSHELRTPLSVLLLQIDTLDDTKAAQDLRQDVIAMSRLVNQILSLAQVDALDLEKMDKVDLSVVCKNVATRLFPLAIKEEMSIEVIGVDAPVEVLGYSHVLEQAIYNLVENAIKYAATGGVITVELGKDPYIKVIDHGPGVPKEKRKEIFQRFLRSDSRGDGAGLGLSIVKQIVEAHKASIDVGDTPGGGATFTIRFGDGI